MIGPSSMTREMVAVRDGDDRDAYARLHARLTPGLTDYVARYVRDDEETVADLVQETWARVWEHRARYLDAYTPATWIYRIARNLALTHLGCARVRKRACAGQGGVGMDEGGRGVAMPKSYSDMCPDPILEIESRMMLRRVLAEVGDMGSCGRAILLVSMGDSYESVADLLGVPLGTVKSRVSRGRGHLREKCYGGVDRL